MPKQAAASSAPDASGEVGSLCEPRTLWDWFVETWVPPVGLLDSNPCCSSILSSLKAPRQHTLPETWSSFGGELSPLRRQEERVSSSAIEVVNFRY